MRMDLVTDPAKKIIKNPIKSPRDIPSQKTWNPSPGVDSRPSPRQVGGGWSETANPTRVSR